MLKNFSHNIISSVLIVVLFAAVIFVASYSSHNVKAVTSCTVTPQSVQGWLWSSTIGWISLSCADEPIDLNNPTSDYGVSQDSQGNWSGHGWSPFIGWVKFDAGCPPGTSPDAPCSTRLNGASLEGWAQALAANNPGSGGWDGWISMDSKNDSVFGDGNNITAAPVNFGVTKTGNHLNGYAWGSDVVGWVLFNNVTVPEDGIASIEIVASPASVTNTNPVVMLQYHITSGSQYFNGGTCTATNSASDPTWTGTRPNLSQGNPVSLPYSNVNVPANNTTYTITCDVNIPGNPPSTTSDSVTVGRVDVPTGDVTLSTINTQICVAGSQNGTQQAAFSWQDTLSTDTSCSLYRDGQPIVTGGALIDNYTESPFLNDNPPNPHSYQVKCTPANGSGTHDSLIDSVYVYNTSTVSPINCSAANWWITIGGGPSTICPASGTVATITWQQEGSVPPVYTKTILYRSPTSDQSQGSVYSTTNGISGTASGINQAGYYWVRYSDDNGNLSPASGVMQIAQDCVHVFNGPSGLAPLCPSGSANQVHSVPKTFSWTSNADTCTANGDQPILGGSGTFNVTSAIQTQGNRSVSCHWNDGTDNTYSVGYYGPMLATQTTGICGTATVVKNPRVKEE